MKNLIKFFLVSNFFFCSSLLFAQDLIYKQDGSTINGKIVEIGIDNIIYSNSSNQEIEIRKVDVKKLVYKNGKEEIINNSTSPAQRVVAEPAKPIKTKPAEIEQPKISKITFDSPKTLYLAIHLGAAIPLGDNVGNNLDHLELGYATTGFNFNFEAGYYVAKYFAVGAKLFSMSNTRDVNELSSDMKIVYKRYNGVEPNTSVIMEPFSFSGALFGLKGCLPINRFSAEVGLWAGYASTNFGLLELEYTAPDGSGSLKYNYPELSSSGLGMGIDLSLKFDISKRLFLAGQFEYLTHNAEFSSYNFTEYYYNEQIQIDAQKLTISSANLSLGLGFVFRKKNK